MIGDPCAFSLHFWDGILCGNMEKPFLDLYGRRALDLPRWNGGFPKPRVEGAPSPGENWDVCRVMEGGRISFRKQEPSGVPLWIWFTHPFPLILPPNGPAKS